MPSLDLQPALDPPELLVATVTAADARKASFAPMDEAVALTGMEYGGIIPSGSRRSGRSPSTRASQRCREPRP